MNLPTTPPVVYLSGTSSRLISSVAVCLVTGGSKVIINSEENKEIGDEVYRTLKAYFDINHFTSYERSIRFTNNIKDAAEAGMSILLTNEDVKEKTDAISNLEKVIGDNHLIFCNTESISLTELQKFAINPKRIIGANWAEPVYTTGFLEIITNEIIPEHTVNHFIYIATVWWRKDPYIARGGYSVRARLMCSMLREAFFLVENGYADFEDIDRACRNDAGYYLAFAGNFRYMDLMGLHAYGQVMIDLNSELSKSTKPPQFFTDMISRNDLGMHSGKGFYEYEGRDVETWERVFKIFSFEIDKIIRKYPLNIIATEEN